MRYDDINTVAAAAIQKLHHIFRKIHLKSFKIRISKNYFRRFVELGKIFRMMYCLMESDHNCKSLSVFGQSANEVVSFQKLNFSNQNIRILKKTPTDQ